MTRQLRLASSKLLAVAPSRSSLPIVTTSLLDVWSSATFVKTRYSTMTSSQDDLKDRGQQPMLARQREREQTQQTQNRPWLPLGYREGFTQWWTSLTPATTEHRVLSFIPYLQRPPSQTQTGAQMPSPRDTMPIDKSGDKEEVVRTESPTDPYGPRTWHSNLIELSGKNRALNEFSVSRTDEEIENNLVMLHGYGAGLGFFYKNFEPLSRLKNWNLFALDLLGMGRSSRPPFKIHAKEKEAKTREAEDWFIDALEEWRVKKGITKMTLLGHSLGGYMAVCYALKYPGHLNKLILASPVGIPEDPYAVREDIPEPQESSMESEFTQNQEDVTTSKNNKQPPPRKMPKWLVSAWDANISPFSLVRMSGPLGPRLVSGWTSRRFSHLPAQESQALHDYSYSLFRQRGSGEYALTYVLAPGAYARSPLIRRIQGVGRQLYTPERPLSKSDGSSSLEKVRETGVPIVMLYGDSDWMDVNGGYAASEKLNEQRRLALSATDNTDEGRKARLREIGESKVVIIKKSGHHVYLDGVDQFNDVVLKELKDVEETQKRLKRLDKS